MGILDDEEQAAVIPKLAETSDSEAAHYERIFWTTSYIDYIFLWLLEDDAKAAGNSALGKIADGEWVLRVELEEYEAAIACLEYPLTVYVGVIHKTNPSSILST